MVTDVLFHDITYKCAAVDVVIDENILLRGYFNATLGLVLDGNDNDLFDTSTFGTFDELENEVEYRFNVLTTME